MLATRDTARSWPALDASSPLLVSYGAVRLHWRAARALAELASAAARDGVQLVPVSGWRAPLSSAEWAQLVAQYGGESEARKWRSPDSLHTRGIAVDFGGELEPKRASADAQRRTQTYRWLVANAERFGWGGYEPEPWHWEFRPAGFRPQTTATPLEAWHVAALVALALAALVVLPKRPRRAKK